MNSSEFDKPGAVPFKPPFQNTIELELSDEEINFLEEQIPYLFAASGKEAFHEALAAGLSGLYSEDDKMWEAFPDRSLGLVKDLQPSIYYPVGTVFKIG